MFPFRDFTDYKFILCGPRKSSSYNKLVENISGIFKFFTRKNKCIVLQQNDVIRVLTKQELTNSLIPAETCPAV